MIGDYIEEGLKRLHARGLQTVHGAETGSSVRANRSYIDSILLEMRMIDSIDKPDTSISFLGQQFATPVMSAALSRLNSILPDGLTEVAKGMAKENGCMWVGIGPEQELIDVRKTNVPTIKIIKPYRDHDLIFRKIEQAEKAGCFAIGMDTDFFYGSQRGDAPNAFEMVSPKSSSEMRSFIEATKLPFIFKGVLSEKDAEKALELGAAALVISSHSGASMDYAVPPMRLLPRIVRLTQGKVPLLIDGGIKRGSDVFKAIALGADGVLVGRALLAGLEMDAADGVAKVVNGITTELRRIMGQTGCASLREIDPSILWMP